jgi:hypothetical protein
LRREGEREREGSFTTEYTEARRRGKIEFTTDYTDLHGWGREKIKETI